MLLSPRLREEIAGLGPDGRLDELLRQKERLEVPVDDAGILLNVNEPDDLERAAQLLASS